MTGALFFLLSCLLPAWQSRIPEFYKPKDEKLPAEVGPQPIPFSHKQHAEAGLQCKDCHAGAAKKERAGLPRLEKCMLCHTTIAAERPAVQRVAEFHQQGTKVEWVRVYQVPDFVFFSHARHLKAGEECRTCHGPVEKRDVLAKEVSTSMIACMNCHQERQAPNSCVFCHQLGH